MPISGDWFEFAQAVLLAVLVIGFFVREASSGDHRGPDGPTTALIVVLWFFAAVALVAVIVAAGIGASAVWNRYFGPF